MCHAGSPADSSDNPGSPHESAGGSDIELDLDSPTRRKGTRKSNDEAAAEEKGRRMSAEDGGDSGMGDYWDEEDELEDYVMRRDLELGKGGGEDSADELSGASRG